MLIRCTSGCARVWLTTAERLLHVSSVTLVSLLFAKRCLCSRGSLLHCCTAAAWPCWCASWWRVTPQTDVSCQRRGRLTRKMFWLRDSFGFGAQVPLLAGTDTINLMLPRSPSHFYITAQWETPPPPLTSHGKSLSSICFYISGFTPCKMICKASSAGSFSPPFL